MMAPLPPASGSIAGPPTGPLTELVVCTTCSPAGAPRDMPAAGERLLRQVVALATAAPMPVQVRGVACLSGCSRACTIALQAPGKHSYVFGGLGGDPDTAAQVLACARQHAESPDGLLAWSARPERLRRGILARLPPLLAPAPDLAPTVAGKWVPVGDAREPGMHPAEQP
jgi:predicted metal-binding protein